MAQKTSKLQLEGIIIGDKLRIRAITSPNQYTENFCFHDTSLKEINV